MSKNIQPLRGMHDIIGDDFYKHNLIIELAQGIAESFNYKPIQTPIMEESGVFHRTLGETSDMVSKETYSFNDRDTTMITLRPEFTAAMVRAIISGGFTQSMPIKWFSSGPLFRHERPQKGRYRQFHQINCEYFGPQEAGADAELILIAHKILRTLGVADDVNLEINSLGDPESRANYRDALYAYLSQYKDELSEESQRRLEKNPLRILDSKNAGDKEICKNAPKMADYMNDASKERFEEVLSALTALDIPYQINPNLVRGMDYYTHTVFEFTTEKLGSQGTVLAGGRYDRLSEIMGGPAIPAIGFAAGVERLAELTKCPEGFPFNDELIYLLPMGTESQKHMLALMDMLTEEGFTVTMDYSGNVAKRMKKADKLHARIVIILGDDELQDKHCAIKDMLTGGGYKVPLDIDEIIDHCIAIMDTTAVEGE
jgi:histidyl-tRNA synthetase